MAHILCVHTYKNMFLDYLNHHEINKKSHLHVGESQQYDNTKYFLSLWMFSLLLGACVMVRENITWETFILKRQSLLRSLRRYPLVCLSSHLVLYRAHGGLMQRKYVSKHFLNEFRSFLPLKANIISFLLSCKISSCLCVEFVIRSVAQVHIAWKHHSVTKHYSWLTWIIILISCCTSNKWQLSIV